MKRLVLVLVACIALVAPAAAQQSVVERIRREYPTPLAGTHGKFLVEVACQTGKGLLRKDGGTRIALPDGTNVAQDIVMDRDGTHYDILGDGEGAAVPAWSMVTEPPKVDPGRFYQPVCNNTPPAPTPTPPPDPPPAVLEVLRAVAEGLVGMERDIAALKEQLATIAARPAPTYSGSIRIFGTTVPITLEPRK